MTKVFQENELRDLTAKMYKTKDMFREVGPSKLGVDGEINMEKNENAEETAEETTVHGSHR